LTNLTFFLAPLGKFSQSSDLAMQLVGLLGTADEPDASQHDETIGDGWSACGIGWWALIRVCEHGLMNLLGDYDLRQCVEHWRRLLVHCGKMRSKLTTTS
jgi:hypothetical protein